MKQPAPLQRGKGGDPLQREEREIHRTDDCCMYIHTLTIPCTLPCSTLYVLTYEAEGQMTPYIRTLYVCMYCMSYQDIGPPSTVRYCKVQWDVAVRRGVLLHYIHTYVRMYRQFSHTYSEYYTNSN